MRQFLDGLYRWSGGAAAVFLLAICAVVLAQVGANLIDAVAKALTGHAIGLVIPSYAEFAGFFLAAASFLALAYTLRHGGHIRVTLVLQGLGPRARRAAEMGAVLVGLGLSLYFTVYTVLLVGESLEYNDLSPGMVPVPLWVPQSVMAFGLAVLTIAFADELVAQGRGAPPGYDGPAPDWEESGE